MNVWYDVIPPDMAWSIPFSRYAQVVVKSALGSGIGFIFKLSLAFPAAIIRNIEDPNIEEGRWRRGSRALGCLKFACRGVLTVLRWRMLSTSHQQTLIVRGLSAVCVVDM